MINSTFTSHFIIQPAMSFWAYLNRFAAYPFIDLARAGRIEDFKDLVRASAEDSGLLTEVLQEYCKTTSDCLLAQNESFFRIVLDEVSDELKRKRSFWQTVFDSIPDHMTTVRQAWWYLGARDHVSKGKFKYIEDMSNANT